MDLITIRTSNEPKEKRDKDHKAQGSPRKIGPTTSEIPDLFFDEILVNFKLGRNSILVLMFLYRQVWCRPNVYKIYGVNQIFPLLEMAQKIGLSLEEVQVTISDLESLNFIETFRTGQFFVRKYFTEENDLLYGHSYDDF